MVVALSSIGVVAERQLFELETRYPDVKVDKYVIMPTHIHFVLIINAATAGDLKVTAGASPSPTLCDMICAYKSLTTRECNRNDRIDGRKIFQDSFYENVIRNEKGYREVWEYIDENPLKWREDELYNE
ncbi:MAG: hypothetical protein PHS82_10330 [Lachnospiraceae bacterium]|nr:hypothetical protein [Lachnospiraceae bacterium]